MAKTKKKAKKINDEVRIHIPRNQQQKNFGYERIRAIMSGPAPDLNDNLIRKIYGIVRVGNFRYLAAAACGVPIATWQSWITKGNKQLKDLSKGSISEVPPEGKLVRVLEIAESECHNDILQDVLLGDNMQAKLWFLERRYNKLYSKNPNAHIDDETGKKIKLDAADILADRLRQFIDKDE